jgi:hypothetical protein
VATVILDFVPPTDPDIVELHVAEADSGGGPYTDLNTHPAGSYPNYITKVTVTDATDAENWFMIRWENASGGFTPWSDPLPGGTTTYLSKLIDRVILRFPDSNENIVAQEAEQVLQDYLHVDPYASASPSVKYRIWNGMALLVGARVQLVGFISNSAGLSSGWTSGLVSMKSGTSSTSSIEGIDRLLKEAMRLLGLNAGIVAQMVVPEIAGGFSTVVTADISRLLIEVE